MSVIPIDWNPEDKKLRQFAALWVAALVAIATGVAWRSGTFEGSGRWLAPTLLGAIALAGVLGLVFPPTIRPCYWLLTAISWPIGLVVGHILLGLIYFGIFTPIALLFRLIGRDVLRRRFEASTSSYFDPHPGPPAAERYLRQF